MSRVLTIENDEITANNIAAELRKRGFSVDWVNNGRDGMARAMSDEYDNITLDRMLPCVDGSTIVTAMRSLLRFTYSGTAHAQAGVPLDAASHPGLRAKSGRTGVRRAPCAELHDAEQARTRSKGGATRNIQRRTTASGRGQHGRQALRRG